MSTIPEQALVLIVAALTNATTAADRVFRSRELAVTRDESPCIAVYPTNEDTSTFSSGVDDNTFTVTVEVHTRGDPYDALADPLLEAIHRLLSGDASLQALVYDIRKKHKSWEGHEADSTVGFVSTKYELRYLSDRSDLSILI